MDSFPLLTPFLLIFCNLFMANGLRFIILLSFILWFLGSEFEFLIHSVVYLISIYFHLVFSKLYCGGQLIPYVQIALEKAEPNIQSHMYRLHKKGLGPISSPRIREYTRTTSKRRDESCTPKRGKECLWRI